jgi:MHS family citrate/tricarballylate:H+ symporter-like MFS transporter
MVELWLSFIYASYNGAMIVALTEVMPVGVRTSGFSLAYSLATTFGGFTAAICTWLIATTGDNASPGYWMSAAAVCGLAGTFFVYRTQGRPTLSEASSGERVIGA